MTTSPRFADAHKTYASFISEGRLQASPTVHELLRDLTPARLDEQCQKILNRFLTDSSLYAIPVIDAKEKPIALLDRRHFIEFFSKRYARDVFGHRNIFALLAYEDFANNKPLIMEESCSIEDAAQIVIAAGMHHMVTGFLITKESRYQGIANGHDLLNIITQRKQAELYYLAHYDNLTGIPNRMLLADRLKQACLEAARKRSLVALLFIDVDRFKQINDSLGHSAGDKALKIIVERIKFCARAADTVARLGGDEFVVLMEDLSEPTDVNIVAQRILAEMREPVDLHGHSLLLTVSIGSAIYPYDDTDISALLAKADAAMYERKENGRNGYSRFISGTPMYNPDGILIENELRQAIESNQLVLHFQPQFDLANMTFTGVEALVRWRHPKRGLVPPSKFIPIAEKAGLIVQLGEWVLHQALMQLHEWRQQNLPPIRMSVNISAQQFNQPDFPALLKSMLSQYAIAPSELELELTESMLMENVDRVLLTLKSIRSLGIGLAIDDFGTGFSSLSYLHRFPITCLKIDQSFVRDVNNTPANASIARAIVSLANGLALNIIAEGVENPSELTALAKMGCLQGQGYLFAKPMSAKDLTIWWNTRLLNANTEAALQVAG